MTTTTLIATLAARPAPDGRELAALPESVRWLELSANQTGDVDAAWLRRYFSGELLYALSGPARPGTNGEDRQRRLISASRDFDLVELNFETDLTAAVLAAVPADKRMIAWYGDPRSEAEMLDLFTRLSEIPARYYKLVPGSNESFDGCSPLGLLNVLGRKDVVAYASGPAGSWSRVVAAHLGSPLVFGSLAGDQAEEGQLSIQQLIDDYQLPQLRPVSQICGIIGNPILHSLSPRLHNLAYRELCLPILFVPIHVESFAEFWSTFIQSGSLQRLGLTPTGFTVASPHKESSLAFVTEQSDLARQAQSSNLTFRSGTSWKAATTDPQGVLFSLKRRNIPLENERVAVIGCGGSGRAIAAALTIAGADVTLVNRSDRRGRRAADLLQLPFLSLSRFSAEGYSILVNATPVGRKGDALPIDSSAAPVVVDLVYGRATTPLIAGCRQAGGAAIDGREVLLSQVACQFQRMTGHEMPEEIGGQFATPMDDTLVCNWEGVS